MKVASSLLLAALIFAGCAVREQTVTPRPVVTTQPSLDGNVANSGVISSNEHGFIVTPHWIYRYDALLAVYGARLLPPVKTGDRTGIEPVPPNYRVTGQVMVRFTKMNQWRKREQVAVRPTPSPTPPSV